MDDKLCGNCSYIKPTEKDQRTYLKTGVVLVHICTKYGVQIYHTGKFGKCYHPDLVRHPMCVVERSKENQNEIVTTNLESTQISDLIRKGHTYHCSCRQVWGDGICECKYGGIE